MRHPTVSISAWILVVVIVFTNSVASAQSSMPSYTSSQTENIAALDKALSDKNYEELKKRIVSPANSNDVIPTLDWVRARTMEGKTFAVPLLYAQLLWRVGAFNPQYSSLMKTAGLITLYAFLVAHADGFKCVDSTAPAHHIDSIIADYQRPIQLIAGLPEAEKKEIVDTALGMERKTAPLRTNDSYLCRYGTQETLDILKYRADHNMSDEGKETVPGPGGVGKTVLIPTIPNYEPKYFSEREWAPKQTAARATFPTILDAVLAGAKSHSELGK